MVNFTRSAVREAMALSEVCDVNFYPVPYRSLPTLLPRLLEYFFASLYQSIFFTINTMNWTGGRLQRHSTTTDSAAQRQRLHFARVAHLSQRHDAGHSSRTHKPRSPPALPPVQIEREQIRVADDDLYSATPLPCTAKRQRETSLAPSDGGSTTQQQAGESLSEKKRRILGKGDWLGVTIQRPLKLAFASPKNEQDIGKRRKLSHGHKAKYRSAQSRILSPFAAKRHPDYARRVAAQDLQHPDPPAPDVRIYIGGRSIQPGLSSSTAPRRKSSKSPAVTRSFGAMSSSDIMLLDNESIQGYQFRGEPGTSLTRIPESPYAHRDKTRKTSKRPRISGRASHSQYKANELPEDQGWEGVTEESLEKLQNKLHEHHTRSAQISHGRQVVTPNVHFRKTLRPGEIAFSSSSTSIHHPVPQSSKRSILLRSDPSEVTASDVAQVGAARAVVSNSQVFENEIWRSWIAQENSDDNSREMEVGKLPSRDGYVSPGVSVLPTRPPSKIIPAKDAYTSELEERDLKAVESWRNHRDSHGSKEEHLAHKDVESNLSELISHDDTSTRIRSVEGEPQPPANSRQADILPRPAPKDVSPRVLMDQNLQAPLKSAEREQCEDPNELWRKFVCGSSSDEAEASGLGLASIRNSSEQGLDDSSLVAHAATERITGVGTIGFYSDATTSQQSTSSGRQARNYSLFANSSSNLGRGSAYSLPAKDQAATADTFDISVKNISSGITQSSKAIEDNSSAAPHSGSSNAKTHQKMFIFTKPRPYNGLISQANKAVKDENVHIGRGLRRGEDGTGVNLREKRQRDLESNVGSDGRHEVESIEDD